VSRLEPPDLETAPSSALTHDGSVILLAPLAAALCDRYFTAYPDDAARLGPVGRAWCDHDSRFLLSWALQDARTGDIDCVERVAWLGRVLAARGFPVERLARHVDFVAEALDVPDHGPLGAGAARRMALAAGALAAPAPAPG
jgi:hypothetical protein